MVDERNKFGALGLSIFILLFVIAVAVFNFKIAGEINKGDVSQQDVKSEESVSEFPSSLSQPQPFPKMQEAVSGAAKTSPEVTSTAVNKVVHEPSLPDVILLQ